MALAALLAADVSPSHTPTDPVPLGGGSGIVVNGDTLCTLTAIGNDNRGNLIGFTSAHCGGPGAQVAAEGAEAAGVLGTMVAGNDALDYAVIQFDPQKVHAGQQRQRIPDRRPRARPGVRRHRLQAGPDHRLFVRRDWGPGEEPGTIVNQVCGQPGDSGAPVTVNNRLVGMIHGAFSEELPTCVVKYIPLHTPAVTMSFNTQLADITAKNRPGSGFVPVGAPPAASRYLLARIASNTLGSTSVDVSPSSRPSATSRSSRRMILPLRVFGQLGHDVDLAGPRDLADLLGDLLAQLVDHVRRCCAWRAPRG